MHDLRNDLDELWRASARLPAVKGAKSLMFMSPHEQAGTSSIAASFAIRAAERSKRTTWLVDLDLYNNSQFNGFQEGFAGDIGRPGRAYDASFGVLPFFDILQRDQAPARPTPRTGKLLAAHQIEGTRLLVTRFRNDRLAYGQRTRLSSRTEWWKTLRRSADWIIVDAPALEASTAGISMASAMDGVVLVVKSDETQLGDVKSLRREIEAAGGHVLGVIMNHLRADSLFADRLAG